MSAKRFFLVESDTNIHSLFAFELSEGELTTSDGVTSDTYKRELGRDPVIAGCDRPKFFGQLSALLVTKDDLAKAPPMKLVEPEPQAEVA